MRALKTLVKLILWLSLLFGITVGVLVPFTWMYTAANLQNQIAPFGFQQQGAALQSLLNTPVAAPAQ